MSDFCDKYKENKICEGYTKFDKVLELCCYKFSNPNSAKDKYTDIKQFIILWWQDHKDLMEKYTSQQSISEIVQLKNRGSVSLYLHKRVPTFNYKKNTKLVKTWLFDVTEKYKMY